jgi:hypothetical protein
MPEIRKFLENPALPVIGGVFLALGGPDDILVRSWALLLFSAWLIIDLGLMLHRNKNLGLFRASIFCFSCQIICFGQLWLIKHSITKDIKAQQEDVYKNLRSEAILIDNKDAWKTRFSVANMSGSDILLSEIDCSIINFNGSQAEADNDVGSHLFNPPAEMKFGGSQNTAQCMTSVAFPKSNDMLCADLIITARYSLVIDPDSKKLKNFRWVGKKEGDTWGWFLTETTSEGCSK